MATFNPDLPQAQPPSYLGYSQPIAQPEANKTTSTIIEGLANVFDTAVKGADLTTKAVIDDMTATAVDKERDAFTASLQSPEVVAASRSAKNILPDGQGETPQSVEDGLSGVNSLAGANAAGKISPTYYYGRLNSLLKNLRAQFPGYRDYIDEKVSKMVGTNPANAYVANIVRDLNAKASGGTNDYTKKMVEFAISHQDDMPDGQTWAAKVISDPAQIPAFLQARQQWNQPAVIAARQKLNRENKAGEYADQSVQAEHEFNEWAPSMVSSRTMTMSNAANLPHSFDELRKVVNMGQEGKTTIEGTQAIQYGQMISAWKDRTRKEMEHQGQESGWITKMGPEKWNKLVDAHLAPYDNLSRALTEKDIPLAAAQMESIKAMSASIGYGLIKDPGFLGQTMALAGAAKVVGGEQVSNYVVATGFAKGMSTELKEFYKNRVYKAVTQPDVRITGKPYTLNEAIQVAAKAGVKEPSVYKGITEVPNLITNPKVKDEAKINVARAAYDPANINFLDIIPKTTQDPSNPNRVVPGHSEVFNEWTSADKTAELWRLSNQNPNNKVWSDYKTWAAKSFGLNVFTEDLKNLNAAADSGKYNVIWNPNLHNWTLQPKFAVTPFAVPSQEKKTVNEASDVLYQQSIGRINSGLTNMAHIAKTEGTDIDAYLLRLMKDSGVDPSKGGMTIPEQMMRSLQSSRNAPQSPAEPRGRVKNENTGGGSSQFAQETNAPSLKEFIANPTANNPAALSIPSIPSRRPAQDSRGLNGDILGMQIDQIPEGMSARDFLKQLQQQQQ